MGVFLYVMSAYLVRACAQCPWRSEVGSDPLELELKIVMSCRVGAGSESRSSIRRNSTFNC